MEIYLAIVETYLAISFTLFIWYLRWNQKKGISITQDNMKWKDEVRELFKTINYRSEKEIHLLNIVHLSSIVCKWFMEATRDPVKNFDAYRHMKELDAKINKFYDTLWNDHK